MTAIYPPFDPYESGYRPARGAQDAFDADVFDSSNDVPASRGADSFYNEDVFYDPNRAPSYASGEFGAPYDVDGFDARDWNDPFRSNGAPRAGTGEQPWSDPYAPDRDDMFASYRAPAPNRHAPAHAAQNPPQQNAPQHARQSREQSDNQSLTPQQMLQQTRVMRPLTPRTAPSAAAPPQPPAAPPAPLQSRSAAPPAKRRRHARNQKRSGTKIALIFFICLFVVSLAMLLVLVVPRFLARSEYISLSPDMLTNQTSDLSALAALIGGQDTSDEQAQALTPELLAYYKETNPDFIGWLDVPDTQIHYPIVRGSDNDYYLTHTFKKLYSAYGAIFADYRCADNLSDANTVIYGHNMRNGSMFHDLTRMLDSSYLAEHDTFTIASADAQVYTYRIFSVHEVSIATDYRTITLAQDASRTQYFETLHGYSDVAAQPAAFSTDSQIVTFSTCPNDSDDNYRIAVHAILESVEPLN